MGLNPLNWDVYLDLCVLCIYTSLTECVGDHSIGKRLLIVHPLTGLDHHH